jgi:hypothetical protein
MEEEHDSDLAELPVPVFWQNFLPVEKVPVIWQNCLYVEERASDLAELVVLVIWQNCLYVEERASDLAELPVYGGICTQVVRKDLNFERNRTNSMLRW